MAVAADETRRAALQAGRTLVERLRRATSTHLIELLRAWEGSKPAVRLVIEDDELPAVHEGARAMGLGLHLTTVRCRETYTEGSGDVYCRSVPWDDPAGGAFAAYLGRDEAAPWLAEAESENVASPEIGRALGIPRCCAEAYRQLQTGRSWLDAWTSEPDEVHDRWSNHLASYLAGWSPAGEYLPCRIGCKETAALARLGDHTAEVFGLGDLRHRWHEASARAIVVFDPSLLFLPRPGVHGEPNGEAPVGDIVTHGPLPTDLSQALQKGISARLRGNTMEILGFRKPLWRGTVRLLRFGEVGR